MFKDDDGLYVSGFPGWQDYRPNDRDLNEWSRIPVYGACIVTGRNHSVYAIDCDDTSQAAAIREVIDRCLPEVPERNRSNSGKFLRAFRLEINPPLAKRVMRTAYGAIEFLGKGQHFVAAGNHTSGVPYKWEGETPTRFPTISVDVFEACWEELAKRFAVEPVTKSRTRTRGKTASEAWRTNEIFQILQEREMVLSTDEGAGRADITCPWEDEHTSESSASSTSFFLANFGGYATDAFICKHAHCAGKNISHLKDALGLEFEDVTGASESTDWPVINTDSGGRTKRVEFPIDALPSALRNAAEEVARFTKSDVVSAAVVGLSVAATAIGKRAQIEERPGLYHHPSLFFVIVALSGERKSSVFKEMTRALERWAADQEQEHSQAVAKAQAENAVIDGLLSSMRRKSINAGTTERHVLVQRMAEESAKRKVIPPSPRLFTSDVTEEKLFQKLHAHDGAFAVMSGEGRQVFDSILGRYTGQGRTGDGIYLAGVSGDTITRDRVGNEQSGPEDLAIQNPCLNVCIMVQPDKFRETLNHPSLQESGLIARILSVQPISLIGTRFEEADEEGLNEFALIEFEQVVEGFLNAPRRINPATNRPKPHLAKLGPEAKEARRQWHNVLERKMGDDGEFESYRDIVAKAVTQTVKIALVLHLLEYPSLMQEEQSEIFLDTLEYPDSQMQEQSEISLETWSSAQRLGEFLLKSAISFRDPERYYADRLVEWLKRKKMQTITLRDVAGLCQV
ncbi:MAG: DUF3987 domain-containing protein [Magnetococcales bacterium]|nr:DUF3987 domain-containing protein [Magnetococcales bacterium]MBF0116892.1 DUF3987 domain-containing protein [Magnetococcales bacterium]